MGEIPYHHLTRKVTTISPYKCRSILPQKVCGKLAPKAVDLFLSFEDKTDLGIGKAASTHPPGHLVLLLLLADNTSRRIDGSAQRLQPAPVQYWLKKHHQIPRPMRFIIMYKVFILIV